ncbi:hypothetical protein J3E74DRAFT_423716 [Bipolaris maydis]|nr:hypothetical protein J3E74DRAFT_423716 [Bipolaris maydis]
MLLLPFFLAVSLAQIVPFNPILPVLTSPLVQTKAEEELHYQLVNVGNTTCQATLTFDNTTFLPISAIANPKECAGNQ